MAEAETVLDFGCLASQWVGQALTYRKLLSAYRKTFSVQSDVSFWMKMNLFSRCLPALKRALEGSALCCSSTVSLSALTGWVSVALSDRKRLCTRLSSRPPPPSGFRFSLWLMPEVVSTPLSAVNSQCPKLDSFSSQGSILNLSMPALLTRRAV